MAKIIYHLYSAIDVKKWRTALHKEQDGCDALTGLPLDSKDAVMDHNHKTHKVRGVIHRQANAVLGKIENMWTRYLKFWYPGTLPQFLRQCANYLEKPELDHIVHPGWLKGSLTRFNSLSEGRKRLVLMSMGLDEGGNASQRKEAFKKALKSKRYTLEQVNKVIDKYKEQTAKEIS